MKILFDYSPTLEYYFTPHAMDVAKHIYSFDMREYGHILAHQLRWGE